MTFELLSSSLLLKLWCRTTTIFKLRPLSLRLINQTQLGNTHVRLLWKSFQLVAGAATYTTHNRWTFMPSVGFEPSIPVVELLQIYCLDRTATGISVFILEIGNNNKCFWHFTKLKFKTHPLIKWIYQLYFYSNFNGEFDTYTCTGQTFSVPASIYSPAHFAITVIKSINRARW